MYKLGMDGLQPHVQGSTTPADLFKGTKAGPLKKWCEVYNEDSARAGLCDGLQVLQANLSPTNPRTMQHHNCMQQALVAEGVCTIPKEHAREEEEKKVRRSLEVDCVGKPVAKKQHISSSMGPAQHKQFHCLMAIHFINC